MHIFTSLILLIPIVSCLPQSTEGPNYTKLSDGQVKHLQGQGFGPTVPSGFRPTVSLEEEDDDDYEEDVKVSQTQARAPIYSGENYPNAIPINQQRPQIRQQPAQRRPVQQFYRPQYLEVWLYKRFPLINMNDFI